MLLVPVLHIGIQTSPARVSYDTRVRLHERALGGKENRRHRRIAMKRDQSIDVLCLCETWHNEDSVSIRRLRAEGLQVFERARPRSVSEFSTLSTNHGGVVTAAS